MLKINKTSVMNLENSIRGARNPMNSWEKSDRYHSRKNHKLNEWHVVCEWIGTLPYATELIIGE